MLPQAHCAQPRFALASSRAPRVLDKMVPELACHGGHAGAAWGRKHAYFLLRGSSRTAAALLEPPTQSRQTTRSCLRLTSQQEGRKYTLTPSDLSRLVPLSLLRFVTTLDGTRHPHFTEEEIEAQTLAPVCRR